MRDPPQLLPLRCPLSERCGVGGHRGANELLEGCHVELLPFAEVDRPPRAPVKAGVEELLRVLDGGTAKERELHDLLVGLTRADATVMGPDGDAPPLPLLLDVGVSIVNELADVGERRSSPVRKLLDALGDVC